MIALRRRSITARSGIVAAVIGVLAITSLSGATDASGSATVTAKVSAAASPSSAASGSEGHTKCVPWPKPTSQGLKCTGTYSGNTAWNPWTWRTISQQPAVTVSQAKDLTDQGVQITWSDFTPSLDTTNYAPNPATINPLYQVSIFECEGTNPNPSSGFGSPQCYTPQVGSSLTLASSGPANGLLENTLDTSSPPKHYSCPASNPDTYYSSSPMCGFTTQANTGYTIPYKSKWDGGNPATWTGQADFHVEAPTPRSQGGFFNCGPRTPCSLVIVPNWGGTPVYKNGQYSWTNTSECDQHWIGEQADPNSSPKVSGYTYNKHTMIGNTRAYPNTSVGADLGDLLGVPTATDEFPYGQSNGLSGNGSVAPLQGASYACWDADRIVIPLSFAPTPTDCSGSNTPSFYAQGSPMMQTQMLQWEAGWCTGSAPVTLDYTSNSESVAREDFLGGSQVGGAATDMALVTLPATTAERQASHRQFTYAPLANSGVGIAYLIDDTNTGSQINRMVLDPRLLAKLTTQSYTLQYGSCAAPAHHKKPKPSLNCDPAVQGNAYSLFDDQEFLSLNRQCEPYGMAANYTCSNQQNTSGNDDFPEDVSASGGTATGVFLPTVLEPDSDMTYGLTGWIASNSDAAAFLGGKRDQWGMSVNSNYLNVSYPTSSFPVLDNGFTQTITCSKAEGCPVNDQDVTMQASWNPQPGLNTIATDLLTDQPTAASPTDDCPSSNGCSDSRELTLTSSTPAQLIGSRDLLSELDLGDIAGYQFPAADLVNAAGKAVGPTQASVESAVSGMKTNPDGITQYYDFSNTDPNAYPLSMVDYAMVPTCGLSSEEASAIADFLTKVATTGQTQGEAPGDLAPGYYPLNATQKAQTLQAAQEVQAQTCTTTASHTQANHSTGKPASRTSAKASPSPRKTPTGGHRSPSSSPTRQAQTTAFGVKSADSGMAGLLLLLAIVIGVLLMLGGPTIWVITVTGRWPVVLRWVRAVRARLRTGLGRLAGRVVRRA